MGRFDGVLLCSDFDNTLVDTNGAAVGGGELPPVPERSREALERFMAQGGRFAVATGRALPAFVPFAAGVPTNAPCVLSNGAALYDMEKKTYVATAFLPDSIRERGNEILAAVPGLACELYHDGMEVHCMHPNDITTRHKHLTHAPCEEVADLRDAPGHCAKLLLEGDRVQQEQAMAYLRKKGWDKDYEIVPSSDYWIEVTAKGASKGGMIRTLAKLLGTPHIYGIGDHLNDLSMLAVSEIGFAPANSVEQVLSAADRVVCTAAEGALADVVDILGEIYR